MKQIEKDSSDYLVLKDHYEKCFENYGYSHKGMDWPNLIDLDKRFEVMTQIVKDVNANNTFLDLGCGVGLLLDYIENRGLNFIDYKGLDISKVFIEYCRTKHPNKKFIAADILSEPNKLPSCDYIIMNGLFTLKSSLHNLEMRVEKLENSAKSYQSPEDYRLASAN